MQFKVGDRVEAIKPPVGVEDSEADQVGPGELIAINPKGYDGETHKVLLDSGDSWWYSEDRLRHPIVSKPTPTPSITVGTQVRLTGVVTSIYDDGSGEVALRGGEIGTTIDAKEMAYAEVIRQPFKRGEVVWDNDTDQEYVITGDEDENGKVCAVLSNRVAAVVNVSASIFERRP